MVNQYTPKTSSPSGHTLYDLMVEREWSVCHLAQKLCWSVDQLVQVFMGLRQMTLGEIQDICDVFGTPGDFWNAREHRIWGHPPDPDVVALDADVLFMLDEFNKM